MKLIEALRPGVQKELARCGIAELVSVSFSAIPDPEKPDDSEAMKFDAYVGDNFLSGIPSIDRALDAADALASSGEDDLAPSLRDDLLVTLDTRKREFVELREGKVNGMPAAYLSDPAVAKLIRPCLEHPRIDALVWSTGWCVATDEMDSDTTGPHRHNVRKLLVYPDEPLMAEGLDDDSWFRIRDRIRRVDLIIGGMMAGLLGEETIRESP